MAGTSQKPRPCFLLHMERAQLANPDDERRLLGIRPAASPPLSIGAFNGRKPRKTRHQKQRKRTPYLQTGACAQSTEGVEIVLGQAGRKKVLSPPKTHQHPALQDRIVCFVHEDGRMSLREQVPVCSWPGGLKNGGTAGQLAPEAVCKLGQVRSVPLWQALLLQARRLAFIYFTTHDKIGNICGTSGAAAVQIDNHCRPVF